MTKRARSVLPPESHDIYTPMMFIDIQDLAGDIIPDVFMDLCIKLYTVAYIRGKQDIIKLLKEDRQNEGDRP